MARRFVLAVAGIVLLPSGIALSAQASSGDDVTPPSVTIISPAGGITTRKEEIAVKARVTDDLSGIASVTCNGEPAEVVKKTARCSVPLLPGLNSVILKTIDVAGNSASAGIQITRRVKQATFITLTPGHRTLLVNEEMTLSLQDDSGVQVVNARWKTSNAKVVSLSGDDPPLLKALKPGSVTISAKKSSLTSTATIAVVAGTELAPGTIRWSVPATPGRGMAPPIYANRVDETSPDLFMVEPGTFGEATLRGVDGEGRVMWMEHSPGIPLMGDSFGGVIAGVPYNVDFGPGFFRALLRLGDAGGVPPWRYESAGILLRPAQAPDGALYAIELTDGGVDSAGNGIWDKDAIVIDGTTGLLLSRTPLDREIVAFESENDGLVLSDSVTCRSTSTEMPPETAGPIVGSDGRGYLLVRRSITRAFGSCIAYNPLRFYPRRQEVGVDLIALSATNFPMVSALYSRQCNPAELETTLCDQSPDIYQLLPDGVGGLLASWRRPLHETEPSVFFTQSYVTRIDAGGGTSDTPVEPNFWIDLIGQAGTAYVHSNEGTSALDVASWTTKWTTDITELYLFAAQPDGGAAATNGAGDLQMVGPSGQVEEGSLLGFSPGSMAHEFDGWIGIKGDQLTSVAGQFQDATRWTVDVGNRSGQLAVRRAGMGIFLKSQDALSPFLVVQHNSVRVVPFNQDWLASQPSLDSGATDGFGNRYFTLGAGLPDGIDTGPTCGGGNLTKGINRTGDVNKPVKALRKLPVAPVSEGALILSLLNHFDGYANNVPYWCTPGDPDSTTGLAYNSNSFAHGLLHAAGVPHEESAPRLPAPGWSLPLPAQFFRPH